MITALALLSQRLVAAPCTGALLFGLLGVAAGCGDQFQVVEGNLGEGGAAGTRTGSSTGSTSAGPNGPNADAANAALEEAVCDDDSEPCVVDWLGVWDEPGHRIGPADEVRLAGASDAAVTDDAYYFTVGHAVFRADRLTRDVELIAGSGEAGQAVGAGQDARFDSPTGIVVHQESLYVADTGNRRIVRVDLQTRETESYLTTLVSAPTGLTIRPSSLGEPHLLIADVSLHTVLSVALLDVAPNPGVLVGSHGTAGNNSVLLNQPTGLAVIDDTLFITEAANHWVRSVDLSRPSPLSLRLEWGSGSPSFAEGAGASAALSRPMGIATDGIRLFIVDADNHVLRVGNPGGTLELFAGSPGEASHLAGSASSALFDAPRLLAFDSEGDALLLGEGTVLRRIGL